MNLRARLLERSTHSRSATGFALWDTLLLVILVAALLLVTFIIQQSRIQIRTAQDRIAVLDWADDQIAGFAAANRRLPCPDTNNDGIENCEAGATTGTLPVTSMGLKADAAMRGPVRINYGMLRPAAPDMAVLSSLWEPEQWDGTAYAYGTANALDFCEKMLVSLETNGNAVAYTLGVAQRDGEPMLEHQRTVQSLANRLSCVTTISSVNGIALAVDVVNEVIDQQASTKEAAALTIAFNVLHIVLAAIDVALAAVGLAASIAILATAAAALAGAIASCIVLVGCAFIPVYTAAVVSATTAIVLFGVAIGLGAAGIVALVVSTALAIEVAIKTGNSAGDQTLDIDLSTMEQAAIDAETKATDLENDAAAELVRLNQSLVDRNNALTNVTNLTNAADSDNTHDALVNLATSRAVTLENARIAAGAAQGEYDRAVDLEEDLTTAYAQAQVSCAGANLPSEQYKCDSVPIILTRLQAAQADVPVKLAARNAASGAQTTAQTNYDSARLDVFYAFYNESGDFFGAFDIYNAIDTYRDKYYVWQQRTSGYAKLHQAAIDARASATQARAAYEQIKYDYEHPGSVPTGSAINVWQGAEAILQQADANGVLE